jgi:hypothetical protein
MTNGPSASLSWRQAPIWTRDQFLFFSLIILDRYGFVDVDHPQTKKKKKKTPWSESASELYRPSDRRLSAKRLPTFADKGATWSARRIPTAVLSVF